LDRDRLIQQVKSEYARLAGLAGGAHITDQSYGSTPPEAHYERVLEKAIRDISVGRYDDCVSGLQVVERITNHKTKAQRIQDNIEATLHNMEAAEELRTLTSDSKEALRLEAENERRAEVIPGMIREMREERAREELAADSPNVIGGGGNG
jgi:hypothetical protein